MQTNKKESSKAAPGSRHNSYADPYGDYLKLTNASSAKDMTGLIPGVLHSDAEAEFYDEMYQFLPIPEDRAK